MLAACSRTEGASAHAAPKPDRIRQAELSRPDVVRGACAGAAAIAILDHRAELTLTLSPPSLGGHGELRLRALAPATAVQLDASGLQITAASSGGQPLQPSQARDSACIALSRPLAEGEELTLALSWQADPRAKGLSFAADQAFGVHSPAWLPTRLEPAQRATLRRTLTVPEGLDVVPGQLFDMLGDGVVRATELVNTAMPPALYTFAVGYFRKSYFYGQGFALSAIGPAEADLVGVIELTLPVYQYFRERLGPSAARGYSQLFVRGDVSQETPGMSLLPEDWLRDLRTDPGPTEEWAFAHALAHQWFGVLVPCEDLWLSEGLATFMVGVMKERRWGHTAYESEVARWRSQLQALRSRGLDSPLAPSTHAPESQLRTNGAIYYRGALVLDKLRRELGEEKFWDGLQYYVSEQAGKPTRTADLQSALQASSGRDLSAFFARWVYAAETEP